MDDETRIEIETVKSRVSELAHYVATLQERTRRQESDIRELQAKVGN